MNTEINTPVSYRVREIWPQGLAEKWPEQPQKQTRDEWLAAHGQTMLGFTYKKADGETVPLFDKVEISKGRDDSGNIVFIRTYHTTKERLDYYNENHRKSVFESSGSAFPGINDKPNSPVAFQLKNSLEDKAEFDKAGEHFHFKDIYSKHADKEIIYGVRIDLKAEPKLNPPYEEWLKEHINGNADMPGMLQLTHGEGGKPLFTGVRAKMKEFPDGSQSFLIEYNTTEAGYAHYVNNQAAVMRSIIEKTYPGIFTEGQALFGVLRRDSETIPLKNVSVGERGVYSKLEKMHNGKAYAPAPITFEELINKGFVAQRAA